MGTLVQKITKLVALALVSSYRTNNMKVLIVALCSLAFASAINVEICDPDITEANFDNLDIAVSPDPIVLKSGAQVGLHFAIDLLKQIDGGTVKIDIKNGPLPIPCIEIDGHMVGSCKYTTESLVAAFCALCAEIGNCEDLLPPGQECSLPAMPGHYGGVNGGDDFVFITLPELPDEIIGLLTGTLTAHILGEDATGAEDLCADVTIDVVAG